MSDWISSIRFSKRSIFLLALRAARLACLISAMVGFDVVELVELAKGFSCLGIEIGLSKCSFACCWLAPMRFVAAKSSVKAPKEAPAPMCLILN